MLGYLPNKLVRRRVDQLEIMRKERTRVPQEGPINKKVVVLEVNEVPLKVFRHYADLNPDSAIARLWHNSLVIDFDVHRG